MAIIPSDRSIIPSCDVDSLERLKELVEATGDIEEIGGYKIGFTLVIPFGMKAVINTIRMLSGKPIIYDHQKAATDIPDVGAGFMRACAGADAVILFPAMGPETLKAWVAAAKEENMPVIVGGEMTHKAYLAKDGGFVSDDAPEKMYSLAAKLGVADFVVPGNKPERIAHYKRIIESCGISPTFYSPGLVAQGGSAAKAAKAAGRRWHAIVGRGIYDAPDMRKAAAELAKALKQ
ncbi:TPA: hypothetical protein HA361_06335 [Candidatus Woesearchaeota archaeon]|nr:hypothetical protein [Candidatus Woesearchaeota archaeon]HII69373.1 hypothetical protein [Candidatus Woesearchaeota archaeon]